MNTLPKHSLKDFFTSDNSLETDKIESISIGIDLSENYVWFIAGGFADVFISLSQADEYRQKAYGAKHHLFRVESGHCIFKMASDNKESARFTAVIASSNVLIYKIKFEDFFSLLKRDDYRNVISGEIDEWINLSFAKLSEGIPIPSQCIGIKNEARDILNREYIKSFQEVLWCNLSDTSRILARYRVVNISDSYFPINNDAWIVIKKQTKLFPKSTEEVISENLIYNGFSLFISFISRALISRIKHQENETIKKIKEKEESQNNIFIDTISKFSKIFTKEKIATVKSKNLFNKAFSYIGNIEGITFINSENVDFHDIDSRVHSIAESSNIKVRKILLEKDWYGKDSGTILGFLKKNMTPVVLNPKLHKYRIYNPETNITQILTKEVYTNGLADFAYMFYRPLPSHELKAKDIFLFALKGNKKDIIIVAVVSLISSIIGLITPIATGIVFDTIIPSASISQLAQIALVLFVCSFLILLLSMSKSFAFLRLSTKSAYKLQAAIWDRLLSLPTSFFNKYTSGDIAQRSMGFEHIRQVMDNAVFSASISALFSIGYLFVMFYYSVSLALIGLLISIVIVLFSLSISLFLLKYEKQIIKLEGEIAGVVLQFVSGISKLKMSGSEKYAFSKWGKQFEEKSRLSRRASIINNINKIVGSIIPTLASITIFMWIILELKENSFSAGTYIAFNSAYLSLQSALLGISGTFLSIINIIPTYNRLKSILTTVPETNISKKRVENFLGNIEISNLSFKYDSDGPNILNNISLDIKQGQFVAIVGSSGSGKSTLMRILLGFEKPTIGSIYFDNIEMSEMDVKDLRKQFGVVLQNSTLISGTIHKNIVGAASLTIEDAWKAAEMAGCKKDIENMPMQMYTMVNSQGSTISGGQKQRIMIARALIKNPKVLLFDEATSALDNKAQSIINKTVDELQMTRVVIAHRLSTIIGADVIYVLENGNVVQRGTFNSLMEDKDGVFFKQAQRQLL